MTFENLSIIEPIRKALEKKGYLKPTPIQEKSIPVILSGKDLFGCAQTGTGKTAAFAIPLIQLLASKNKPNSGQKSIKVLILAPTRELALQISENIDHYGKNTAIKHAVIFGGVSQNNQVTQLKKGIDILIATPGRLLDLMQQGFIHLNTIEHLVLDEADRMLDMGFIHDIKRILVKIPKQRQTLFFSATVPPEIQKLAASMLSSPEYIEVTPVSSSGDNITQSVYFVNKGDKKDLLNHLIKKENIAHALVFTRTKHGADKVVRDLSKNGIKAAAIHGNKSQNARQSALQGFKSKTIRILVATDIASRGIDVDKLSHVINYELPEVPETYVHRIGRTGRAGATGIALSFCTKDEEDYLKRISKLMNKNINVVRSHPYAN